MMSNLNIPASAEMLQMAAIGSLVQQVMQKGVANQIPNLTSLPMGSPKKQKGHEPRKGEELMMAAQMGMPLTREELANVMVCSPETISNWVAKGLHCIFIGKRKYASKGSDPRFIYSDVLAWAKKQGEVHKDTVTLEDLMSKYAA